MEFSIDEFNAPSKSFKHNYKKLCKLGIGSFGKVYKAKEIDTEKIVAVKQISINNSVLNHESILKEINVLSNISHPNIVKYYKYYEENDRIYIIMEYLEGGTLKEFINDEKNKITEDICRIIIKQILDALNHLHYICDICHRDIKPENIMFRYKDNIESIKLIDFGLSSNSFENKNYLENCGTLIYMAPEQISNKIYSKSVDIWSVGIILYMLLNGGKNPFYNKGDPREKIIPKIRNKKVEFDDKDFPISEMGKDFIKKLLMKNSSSRYTARPALNHPWITMEKFEKIPMTVLDKLLIEEHINKMKELFLIALFLNYYKNNNLNVIKAKRFYSNSSKEILRKKCFGNFSNLKRKKYNILNNEAHKNNNYNYNFDLEEYFQRVKKSNILLEKKFKENREIMFMTKKSSEEYKSVENEANINGIINNISQITNHENKNIERNNNNFSIKLNKNNTVYRFKNTSNSSIKRNLKKYINNKKKKIKNLIKDSDFSPDKPSRKIIDETKQKKRKINNIESPTNNNQNYNYQNKKYNSAKNVLTTLQEFINKEKSISNNINKSKELFITDNQKDINFKNININDKVKLANNNIFNYKILLKDSKNKEKQFKKSSCINIKINNNKYPNLLKNYSNNKIFLRNKSKNKSVENITTFIFSKNEKKRKNDEERKYSNKYNFYMQSNNNYNKYISPSTKKINRKTIINSDIYNLQDFGEIKPKKLLFDVNYNILPKLSYKK